MPHNFKTTEFTGTLLELFEECSKSGAATHQLYQGHKWIIDQLNLGNDSTLLPVRKHAGFSQRGETREVDGKSYVAVDNEPLAFLLKKISADTASPLQGTLQDHLRSREMPVSWSRDSHENPQNFRYCGVTATFRDNGLKIAHIENAGGDATSFQTRYLRSMSPINMFLFPSPRVVTYAVIGDNSSGIYGSDWCEDPTIRTLALCWLVASLKEHLNSDLPDDFRNRFEPVLRWDKDWEEKAKSIMVKISPKNLVTATTNLVTATTNIVDRENAERIYGTLEQAIDELRAWRLANPNATQLDGGTKNNPTPWFHFRIDGYVDGRHDFYAEETQTTFNGSDYNGIVSFHGDAKAEKIDQLIELFGSAESHLDYLIPSATQVRNGQQRPKFALRGYTEKVEGFYLYHDHWRRRG